MGAVCSGGNGEIVRAFSEVYPVASYGGMERREARRQKGLVLRGWRAVGVYRAPCSGTPPAVGPDLPKTTIPGRRGGPPPTVMGTHSFPVLVAPPWERPDRVFRMREKGSLGSDWDTVELLVDGWGAGKRANVRLVQHKRSKTYIVHKCYHSTPDDARLALAEKSNAEALADGRCPFIADMIGTSRTSSEAQIHYEYCAGADLSQYYPREEGVVMKEANARMLIAQLVLALDHIHANFYIYQALCHSHVLFDARGFVRLVGIGNAIHTSGPTGAAAASPRQPVDVPAYYFPPEVMPATGGGIAGGHTKAVDYWMLGCLLVDVVGGHGPYGDFTDPPSLFEARLREGKLRMPRGISRNCQSFIAALLKTNADVRLQTRQDVEEHPWFRGFDWVALRECKAPVIVDPCVDHPADANNFPPIPPPAPLEDLHLDDAGVSVAASAATSSALGGGAAGGGPLSVRASQVSRGGLSIADADFMKKKGRRGGARGGTGGWDIDLAQRHRAPDHEREHAFGPHGTMTKEEIEKAKALLREL